MLPVTNTQYTDSSSAHHEDAITSERETINQLRLRALADNAGAPDPSVSENLISSLRKLAFHLRALARPQEALGFDNEAVELGRELVGKYAGPEGRDIKHLSSSLHALAWDYCALHRHEEAVLAEKEAIDHRRTLLAMDPGVAKDLAASLKNLGFYLRALEGVRLFRSLPASTAELHSYLHTLAWEHHSVQQYEEAVRIEREAVDLLRRLNSDRDPRIVKELASALKNLACYLSTLAHFQELLGLDTEVIKLQQELLDVEAETIAISDLASSLGGDLDQSEDVLTVGDGIAVGGNL
ncbi:hypothetical protein B0H13DRAFT_1964181 [Mycena leptocephala]|nr:hypothetical protein B0H13DRAFT_1964181 [Mycena leptocephala]